MRKVMHKAELKISNATEVECSKCGYRWEPRVSEPKACPRCKTRLDAPGQSKEQVA